MFGIKWLWKSNKTNIDTSNFVSKEFLNTTLQDYVNKGLLNTTLSNELSNYMNRTEVALYCARFPTREELKRTLTDYVQTDTLTNYVSTNTAQTITGAKTFTEGVVISKNPVPLTLKATDNNKTYIVYKDSSDNSNFSLGANSGQTSLEVNRGDLLIQTQQNNKTVSFETGVIKTNRARLEFGTEINAGYGGTVVKFIPEDNNTKTLQFYNSAAGNTRRFNLLVPEPTAAQNPATKNYVDTKNTEATTYTDTKITETRNYIDTQISGINMVNSISSQVILLSDQAANSTKTNFGPFVKDTIKIATNQTNVRILSAVAQLNAGGGEDLNTKIEFTYSATTNGRYGYLNFMYEGNTNDNTNWQFSTVKIWYISDINTLTDEEPFYIVQKEVNNEN